MCIGSVHALERAILFLNWKMTFMLCVREILWVLSFDDVRCYEDQYSGHGQTHLNRVCPGQTHLRRVCPGQTLSSKN